MNQNLKDVIVIQENTLTNQLLTKECLQFLAKLHRLHNSLRKSLMLERVKKVEKLENGQAPTFPHETYAIRQGNWQVRPVPKEIQKRWIEITGPPSKKGCINAMNSGADCFMADFEDSLAPSWENLLQGQKNLLETNKRTLSFTEKNKEYKFNSQVSTLWVRTRGLHLNENNIIIDGEPMSGAFFDFAVYLFHNQKIRQTSGLGGCFYYLPKLESYKEAALWNDVFVTAQNYLGLPLGTVRCTVLIETIGGSLEMDEILYSLKDHIVALNAGRWDYIFSIIKKFKFDKLSVLPDRSQITMTQPFMKAYTDRLVQICHKRGAHAIGGMSAAIPSKTDTAYNEITFKKIVQDKTREANDGCDGSWVAHPGLVKIAREVFQRMLKNQDHQKHVMREDVKVDAQDLTTFKVQGGKIIEQGVRTNIEVCIQYIYYWLGGAGAVGLNNLMEDAATAEISRGQVWQWIKHHSVTENGQIINESYYWFLRNQIVAELKNQLKNSVQFNKAIEITDDLILSKNFGEFLTLPAYEILNNTHRAKL